MARATAAEARATAAETCVIKAEAKAEVEGAHTKELMKTKLQASYFMLQSAQGGCLGSAPGSSSSSSASAATPGASATPQPSVPGPSALEQFFCM